MRACRTGSAVGALGTLAVLAFGACRADKPHAEIPAVTSATPDPNRPLLSGPATDASLTTNAPQPIDPGGAQPLAPGEPPVNARFVTSPGIVDLGGCYEDMLVTAVRGKLSLVTDNEKVALSPGDLYERSYADRFELKGGGLAVVVTRGTKVESSCHDAASADGGVDTHASKSIRPQNKLVWAGGKMSAVPQFTPLYDRRGIPTKLYLGRLEGTAAVPEHVHEASWEIVAAVEASGTFSLDGKEQRLRPQQIVLVPPGIKHAWKPDPGTKLAAIQMYSPPGPEQRFFALAAADKDGGTPPAAPDAGKR